MRAANRKLRKFLYANLYYNPGVAVMNRRACRMLREVFNLYIRDPSLLGRNAVRRLPREGLERSVCDYLSGMTDGYLLDEHARLLGLPKSNPHLSSDFEFRISNFPPLPLPHPLR